MLVYSVDKVENNYILTCKMLKILGIFSFFPATAALEQQLTSLGERWASVCQWTEQQWSVLQDIQLQWQRFVDAQLGFESWLCKTESSLAAMRINEPQTDEGAVEMVKKIKVF